MVGGGADGDSGDGIRPCSVDGNGITCAMVGAAPSMPSAKAIPKRRVVI
jgi:hypothetical protein